MKHSSIWFALILIALGLLLSGASAASTHAPQPAPRTTPQSHRKGASKQKPGAHYAEDKQDNSPAIDPLAATTPSGENKNSRTNSAARRATEEERHDRREESLERNLVILTAILAGVEVTTLFIFVGTMCANIRAANAAKRSAEAAYAVITTGRPYVQIVQILFSQEHGEILDTRCDWPRADQGLEIDISVPAPIVIFKNLGRTPAIMKNIATSFEPFVCKDLNFRQHEEHERLRPGYLFNEVTASNSFLAPEKSFQTVVRTKGDLGWTISNEQFERMREFDWSLVVYGRLEYGNTFDKTSYVTDFCYVVQPDYDWVRSIKLIWTAGPEGHNRYT